MNRINVTPRIVFNREDNIWVAHSIDFDLVGDGPTLSDAVESLAEAIQLQMLASLKYVNLRNLFPPFKR